MLKDIDPITNPASDNFLTREIARRVKKDNVKQLTQDDFNKIISLTIYEDFNTLPPEIGNLYNLKYLDLSYNNIKILPPEIGNLLNLESLGLYKNNLSVLPSEIGNLNNLKSLHLQYNKLNTLPPEIGNLKNLKELYLEYNTLNALPSEIGDLWNLEILDLQRNNLSVLPLEIGNLKNLKELHLSYNILNALPSEIGNLKKLYRIYLENNKLNTLPPEIGDLYNLAFLGLDNNELDEVPVDIEKLSDLIYLGLSNNKIDYIPLVITKMTQLNSLVLSKNKISNIPVEILNLVNLEDVPDIFQVGFELNDQHIILQDLTIDGKEPYSIINPISILGIPVTPINISNGGVYDNNTNLILWRNSNSDRKESFEFSQQVTIGKSTHIFSGKVIVPVKINNETSIMFPENIETNLYLNQRISIPINFKGLADYYALDITVEYDPEFLEFKSYICNKLKGLREIYVDNQRGSLRYIIVGLGKVAPINSDLGNIIISNFLTKKVGITNLNIKKAEIANISEEIIVSKLGSININISEDTKDLFLKQEAVYNENPLISYNTINEHYKDTNKNGKFTLIDLAIIAYHYNMNVNDIDLTKYNPDIITTGKIDFADLTQVKRNILRNS